MVAFPKDSFIGGHKAPIWLLTLMLAAGCTGGGGSVGSAAAGRAQHRIRLAGQAMGGRQPIVGSTVVVYETGTTPGADATELGAGLTDKNGSFSIPPVIKPTIGAIIYFTANGGNAGGGVNSAILLMTVAGPYCEGAGCNFPASVDIDELTTAASTASMQHFIDFVNCTVITGNSQTGTCVDIRGAVGLVRHAATVNNLINVVNGQGSAFMIGQPTCSPIHTTLETLNTLGNILAACVNSSGSGSTPCTQLFAKTGPAGDTLLAAFEIASSPVVNQNLTLFDLAPPDVIYSPPLAGPPSNWTVGGPVYAYTSTSLCGCSTSSEASTYVVDQFIGALFEISGSPITVAGSAESIAVDPTGKFAYIVDGNNHVAGYTIDPATGTLTQIADSPYVTDAGSASVAVDPTGKFVYVANADSNDVSAYTINATTGSLTQIVGSPFGAGSVPIAVTVDPTGKFAYVANIGTGIGADVGSVSEYTIDSVSGALTQVIGSPVLADLGPNAVAVDPTGKFAYVANQFSNDVSEYTIDSATGALTPIAGLHVPAGTSPNAVTVDPTGQFAYVANLGNGGDDFGSVSAYTIDSLSGALSPTASSPFSADIAPAAVAVDPSGLFAYAANFLSGDISAYNIGGGGVLGEISVASPFGAATNPGSIAVDPTGKFAYVANSGASSVSAYMIDPPTGAMSPASGSPFGTGAGSTPSSVAVDPTSKFAYVADQSLNVVLAYAIDPATGALSPVSGSPFSTGSSPGCVTVDPTGKFVYVTNGGVNTVSGYKIDSSSGALTPVSGPPSSTGSFPNSVAVDPTGKFAYVTNKNDNNISAYSINPATGVLSVLGSPVGTGLAPVSVAVDPKTGTFAYVANFNDDTISAYSIDPGTGALATIGVPVPTNLAPNSVTVDPSGKFAYVANLNGNNISAYTIDPGSGALTEVLSSPFTDTPGIGPTSVAVDPTDQFVYVANQTSNDVSAFTIDPGSGALAPIDVFSPFFTGFGAFSMAIGP